LFGALLHGTIVLTVLAFVEKAWILATLAIRPCMRPTVRNR
jgi:hypothetical protein